MYTDNDRNTQDHSKGLFNYRDARNNFNIGKAVKQAALGITTLLVGLNSFTTINQTERGLQYKFGKLITKDKTELLQPGFNMVWPWISVKKARVDLQHMDIKDMTTNTKDNQVIKVDNTIFFTTPEEDLVTIYKKNPDWKEKLEKASTDAVKSALGHTEAQNVAFNRDSIMDNVTKETKAQIMELLHIDIDRVLMPNYDFDDAYQKAVSAASNEKAALVAKQTQYEQSLIDKKKKIVDAEASAEAQKLSADADAYTTTTTKNAEAEGFDRVQKVIGFQNMGMYLYTNKWNGVKSQYEAGNSSGMILQMPQPK